MQNYIPCDFAEIIAILKNFKIQGWGFPLHSHLTYLFSKTGGSWKKIVGSCTLHHVVSSTAAVVPDVISLPE